MLHAGLDLSRHRLDVHLLDAQGSTIQVTPRRQMPTGSADWSARPPPPAADADGDLGR